VSKIFGATYLATGIVLLMWGHTVSQSVNSQFKNLFTGSPIDKAIYLYLGGAILLVIGIVQLIWKRK
jgi:nitrate reductase gamma subunit